MVNTRLYIAYIFLISLVAIAGSYPLLPYKHFEQDKQNTLSLPSIKHPFGTDELGRDMLSRISYGLGVSLRIGISAAIFATVIGGAFGIVSGYVGGILDTAMMGFIEFMIALPEIVIIVLLTLIFGRGEFAIALAIALVSWLSVARITRNEVLSLKTKDFIDAANILGANPFRIMLKHIFPNVLPIILTLLVLRVPASIIAESSLSFVGLGLKPPHSSLGVLTQEGFRAITFYPHLILLPSLFIIVLVWSVNTIGEYFQQKIK